MHAIRRLALAAVAAFLAACAGAPPREAPGYERRELAIPMRDGVTLYAVALLPAGRRAPLPIILIRTPFGAAREFASAELPARYRELAEDGYLFVTEDIRGRGRSGGTFVTLRPLADPADPKATDESTDAYDTIDWLVKHLPGNDGRVAVIGHSYRGWLAAMAGIHPHPALKAISPQAPVTDAWLGDDFFHQGAFRQTQGAAYAAWIEGDGFELPGNDEYAFYRRFPTLSALAAAIDVTDRPSWVGFREHPAYDAYWQARALQRAVRRPEVPTLVVGGWWDAEDLLGPMLLYRTLEPRDSAGWNSLVLGPWSHGQWLRPGGDSIGAVRLGSATADSFRQRIERPWLAHWLHGTGDGRFPEARVFETGDNAWRTFEAWPPRGVTLRKLYLREEGRLAFDPPPGAAGPSPPAATPRAPARTAAWDAWISDPADPVPTVRRPDDGRGWDTWLVQDQRFLDGRPDVVTWTSEPLAQDLVVAGDVVAHLVASTTGTDADWVVKLIDAWPDSAPEDPRMAGYRLMVGADVLRGRYWKGFERATPIPANVPTPFTVDLHDRLHRFRKGHRLVVQVQSSWFPLYDRNPQVFVPNIFAAAPADYRAQEHRVWHAAGRASYLELPVLP